MCGKFLGANVLKGKILGRDKKHRGGPGGGGWGVVIMSASTCKQIPNQKASNNEKDQKRTTSVVNNTVNKLKLDREGVKSYTKGLCLPTRFYNFRYTYILTLSRVNYVFFF